MQATIASSDRMIIVFTLHSLFPHYSPQMIQGEPVPTGLKYWCNLLKVLTGGTSMNKAKQINLGRNFSLFLSNCCSLPATVSPLMSWTVRKLSQPSWQSFLQLTDKRQHYQVFRKHSEFYSSHSEGTESLVEQSHTASRQVVYLSPKNRNMLSRQVPTEFVWWVRG